MLKKLQSVSMVLFLGTLFSGTISTATASGANSFATTQQAGICKGLIESLERHKVTNLKERQTILRLSDYGRKGTQVWKLLSNTAWSKIGAPGKYIIAALASGRK
jgi:hypothetical protein